MAYKIAIIEDDQPIADMYRIKLSDASFHTGVAINGKQGLILCEELKPDLILLDLMMPEMNGDEMLEKLRATDWGKDIKVIILTNLSEQEIPDKIRELNADKIILKANTTPKQIVDIVTEILNA